MSVNKVILVGNLGRDPEVRYLPSGQTVAKFTLATSDGSVANIDTLPRARKLTGNNLPVRRP